VIALSISRVSGVCTDDGHIGYVLSIIFLGGGVTLTIQSGIKLITHGCL